MKKPTAIDIFCGAGGVSEALKKDFNIVAAVEIDPIVAKTYEINHGNEHLQINDVRKITRDEWVNNICKGIDELDLLVSTPPCQGFSKHSRKKVIESKDIRNNLILETLRLAVILKPKFVLFENVTNIANYKVFHTLLRKLSNIKKDGYKRIENQPAYHIRFENLNAYDYNVPQTRKRLILIAKRIDIFPCKGAYVKTRNLNVPTINEPLNIWPDKSKAPLLGEYLQQFNLTSIKAGEKDLNDKLHVANALSELNLKRIKATSPNGGSRNEWPESIVLECHKKSNVSFGDVYGRMNFNSYAPTITCGCTSYSKGRFGHPIENRAISLREAALIQTFPLEYKFTGSKNGALFEGSRSNIATQIGNAVPVNLARVFIKEIKKYIE